MIDIENDPDRVSLQTWHGRACMLVLIEFVGACLAALGLPSVSPWVLSFVLLAPMLVCCFAIWRALFRIANRFGGRWYAWSQLGTSVVLTPVALSGILLLPILVCADIRRGFAAWRRATALTLMQRVIRTICFFGLWIFLRSTAPRLPGPFSLGLFFASLLLSALMVTLVFRPSPSPARGG